MYSRKFISFTSKDIEICKQQMLNWANHFDICCFFDSNNYSTAYSSYDCLLAVGVKRHLSVNAGNAFDELMGFYSESPDWLFGHLGYDLKNELEELQSGHPDNVQFPDLFFFVPEYIFLVKGSDVSINSETDIPAQLIWEQINQVVLPASPLLSFRDIQSKSRFTKDEYIQTVNLLREHIRRGDCYEINFCQEFYVEQYDADPAEIFTSLKAVSPNPFAAYYKLKDKYLLSASPERYVKKEKERIISQPIKGTAKRIQNNDVADKKVREALWESAKDRAENVMVVDLVRNDLSRVCEEGSVGVEELYGIYSFPQVHQMISTVSGMVCPDKHWVDVIRATFPMGSMTGAPKKKVMELIERYERSRRGIFSGAVGYVTPDGDFDFNVVIRSILYNQTERYLSYQVGSAITFYSDAEMEYEECLLKAAAIKKVLNCDSLF